MGAKHFGARVTRLEDPALLSGRGRFVDDVKMSGVLHACFVRSPYAHARVHGIDAKAALAMTDGAVIRRDDLPESIAPRTQESPRSGSLLDIEKPSAGWLGAEAADLAAGCGGAG